MGRRGMFGSLFNTENNIGTAFSRFQRDYGDMIVVRVIADEAPGYLRGKVATSYQNGSWSNVENAIRDLPGYGVQENSQSKVYPLNPYLDSSRIKTKGIEIFLNPGYQADSIPLPGAALKISMVADQAEIDRNGVIFPHNLRRNISYAVEIPSEQSFASAYPGPFLNRRMRRQYLQIPEEILPDLDAVLQDIFPEGTSAVSQVQKMTGIYQYLQKNYTYSLYPKVSKGIKVHKDPVINFLTRTKQGHCELFASAAALLMRRVGLPTRYVSGILCYRKNSNGDWYYATGDNLHAWIEVYLQNGSHPVW